MSVAVLDAEEAYRRCEQITRHEAANFYYGIRLLPRSKRHAMSAVYAFARDGLLPAVLARVHPRFHTPYVAIVVYATLVASVAVSSSFTQLAVLANVAALTLYLTCVAAAYDLQRRDVRAGGAPFVIRGGPAVPLLAAAVIVWLLSNATRREFAVEGLALATAALFYFIRRTGGRL